MLDSVEAIDLVESNYEEHGRYVNRTRAVTDIDGLKAVYRRVFLALRDVDSGSEVKSSKIIGQCIDMYHPHGDQSIYGALVNAVQEGFIRAEANFGNAKTFDTGRASAYRYTEVSAYKEFAKAVFQFIDYVPTYENEYGKIEPVHLPVPIPLGVTTGVTGIGFGLQNSIPAFLGSSTLDALLADDPTKLKAPKGLSIVSGVPDAIWKTGQGWIQYGLRCYTDHRDDLKTVSVIEGSGRLFKPAIREIFASQFAEQSCYWRDESRDNMRIIVYRIKGSKRISEEEVQRMAQQAAVNRMFFRIYVNENGVTRRRSLRDWMQDLWGRYNSIVETHKTKKIEDLNHKIQVYNLIPQVLPHLESDTPAEVIAGMLNCHVDDIREVEERPLKALRKTDFSQKICALNEQIVDVSKLNAKTLAKDFVKILDKAQE